MMLWGVMARHRTRRALSWERMMDVSGRKQAASLPRALRSSSKFSLFRIFQLPAKLGMSAGAGGAAEGTCSTALMRVSLTLPHPPASSLCSLLLLWDQPPACTQASLEGFSFFFFFRWTLSSTQALPPAHQHVSVSWLQPPTGAPL